MPIINQTYAMDSTERTKHYGQADFIVGQQIDPCVEYLSTWSNRGRSLPIHLLPTANIKIANGHLLMTQGKLLAVLWFREGARDKRWNENLPAHDGRHLKPFFRIHDLSSWPLSSYFQNSEVSNHWRLYNQIIINGTP